MTYEKAAIMAHGIWITQDCALAGELYRHFGALPPCAHIDSIERAMLKKLSERPNKNFRNNPCIIGSS